MVKDILGGVVVSTRRQKNAPRPRRCHTPSRASARRGLPRSTRQPWRRHDRCVTREVGRTRASRVSRTPSPPATRATPFLPRRWFASAREARSARVGRPERSGNARATALPLLGSVSALTGSTALPSLSHAPRARVGTPASSLSGRSAFSLSSRVRSRRSRRLTSRRRRRLDVIDTLSTPDQIVTLWHFPGAGRYPPQPVRAVRVLQLLPPGRPRAGGDHHGDGPVFLDAGQRRGRPRALRHHVQADRHAAPHPA